MSAPPLPSPEPADPTSVLVRDAVRRLRAEQRAAVLWGLSIVAGAAILGNAAALWSNRSAALSLDLAAVARFGCF